MKFLLGSQFPYKAELINDTENWIRYNKVLRKYQPILYWWFYFEASDTVDNIQKRCKRVPKYVNLCTVIHKNKICYVLIQKK